MFWHEEIPVEYALLGDDAKLEYLKAQSRRNGIRSAIVTGGIAWAVVL